MRAGRGESFGQHQWLSELDNHKLLRSLMSSSTGSSIFSAVC
ncbi:hypothetical protein [Sulfurimonas sp. HSL3-7]